MRQIAVCLALASTAGCAASTPAAAHRVVCRIERGTFQFALDGSRIHGRLDLVDGTRYRVIEVERVR